MLRLRSKVNINYHGTIKLTQAMLLKRAGNQARVVIVASRSGELRILRSEEMRRLFAHPTSITALSETMDAFVRNTEEYGERNIYAGTSYGAYTCAEVGFSCMCPGYCKTAMSSFRGGLPAAVGAETASLPPRTLNPITNLALSLLTENAYRGDCPI